MFLFLNLLDSVTPNPDPGNYLIKAVFFLFHLPPGIQHPHFDILPSRGQQTKSSDFFAFKKFWVGSLLTAERSPGPEECSVGPTPIQQIWGPEVGGSGGNGPRAVFTPIMFLGVLWLGWMCPCSQGRPSSTMPKCQPPHQGLPESDT